ncbi:uncharacterized protein LOC112568625 isoform X2 [Pomacea canaliculata]|uniref:uncharacterized protein LOC112568625 isoform X2 n=1 Tax=Pomacea canaliculata TaxID=400727 RepID=UPI000D73C3DD|nr:uncharacterized protein LOC112568625 isoform X2 [Pomacea canaliculata]
MTLFKHIFPQLVFVVIFVFNLTDFLPRNQITCDIRSQTFDLTVVCFFPEDISVSRRDYTVYLYQKPKDPIVVVSCMWPQGQEHVQCSVGPGYKYDELIYPDHISIQIINASHSHLGKYECQLSGYNDLGKCELSLWQIVPRGSQEINTDSTSETISPSVSTPQVGDGDENDENDENKKQHTRVQRPTTTDPAGVIDSKAPPGGSFGAGVVCGIGFTTAVFILGIILWRKRDHFRCLNVGKNTDTKYSRTPQQEESSETADGPADIEEEADMAIHLVVQERDFTDGSDETERKSLLNSPEAKETSSSCQTTSSSCLVQPPDSGRSKEQNKPRDKDNMKTSGLQQEEPISSPLAKSLGQNTLSYESKPAVDDTEEKVGSTNGDTQDPPQPSDDSTRGCGSTTTFVCSGHDKSELHISFTVKVEQHGEGFKADLDKSAICNIMKCKSQGQGESNQDNGHITVDIGEQEVIPSLAFQGLSIGNLTSVLTSQDHYVQETSEKNSMGLQIIPPESEPRHCFGRNSQEEATLPGRGGNHGNQTSKNSNSLLNTEDFDIRQAKKPENSTTSQQNDERLLTAQICAGVSSSLDTENKFSSLNNGEAETTPIRKSKEKLKDVQEGESSPGAQVTSPTESNINIRSHVHSQPLE